MKTHTSPFVIAALSSLALVGCHGGGGSGTTGAGGDVAVVNGEAISNDEYFRYLERKPLVQVGAREPMQVQAGQIVEMQVATSLGFQALRDLINQRVLLDVARDENEMPTADEVKKELDYQTKANPQFMPALTAQGLTLEEIRRDLTIDLAKQKIVTKGITVSPADADAFIKANPDKFKTPEQAKVCLVQVKDVASQKQVDADLAAGKSFEDVAVQHSDDPRVRQSRGVATVGDVGRLAQTQPELAQLIRSTPDGKATDWKPDGNTGRFVKIFVEQKVASKPVPITDTIKENLRRQMAMERGSQATDLQKRLYEKLKTSKIVVNSPALKTLWDKLFATLKDQDVQANTRTAPTAGAPSNGAPASPNPDKK